jgi:DNA polymerase (family 10)
MLEEIANLLSLLNENPFRIRAYLEAARVVANVPEPIEEVWQQGRLQEIPGIGPSIASKIDEYLRTGRSSYVEELRRRVAPGAPELLQVPGLGPRRVMALNRLLGIKSIVELEEAARQHRIHDLPGFGEKTEEKIRREIARLRQRTERMLLAEALPAAEQVIDLLRDHPAVERIDPAGSLRRMKETIGDIDILVASRRPEAVMDAFTTLPIVQEVLAKGPTKSTILTRDNLQIDLRVIKPDEYGAALIHFTGSKQHNIELRDLAIQRGWKLNEYGLFDERTGRRLASRTEEEVYAALGLEWIPPELREARGEIQAARERRLPRLVRREEVRGAVHVHTDWSDGHNTLEEMAQAARANGYEYMVVTDHSPGLGVASGLAPERVRQQHRAIQELNARLAPFVVLHGAEVNIRADGTVDYDDAVLRELDFVTVSVHGAMDQPEGRMTERIVRALRHPDVDVLGHPTGRLLGRREPYAVDLERVLQVAAREGVAVEVNGSPERLDLPDIWVRRAKELGVALVVASDAHQVGGLGNMRYAVATARRGWAEAHDVLNTRSVDAFRRRLRRARSAAPR